MYQLDMSTIVPGCARVIRAENQSEVFQRAVMQARRLGYDRVPIPMLDQFRSEMTEIIDRPMRQAS